MSKQSFNRTIDTNVDGVEDVLNAFDIADERDDREGSAWLSFDVIETRMGRVEVNCSHEVADAIASGDINEEVIELIETYVLKESGEDSPLMTASEIVPDFCRITSGGAA